MPFWRRSDHKVGDRYDGRVAWCADPTSGATRAAFYPTHEDGTIDFHTACEWVEDKPGDLDDTSGHWRVVHIKEQLHFDELPTPNVILGGEGA